MQLLSWCKTVENVQNSLGTREPLIMTPLPEYPWQLVGTVLFELDKCQYLLVVDYFSMYPEVVKLSSTTSNQVIAALKTIFARHGIPETVRSDNGPQYSSQEFAILQAAMVSAT
ncbi:MAG: transposase family protein [Proteobacteria bacterium]|nr:transposase family protein [Pseudomonadota bacterium]